MKDAKIVQALARTQVEAALSYASEVLRAGGVVAFPTETSYGLGADISNETGIRKVFEAKCRGFDQPLLVLIPSLRSLPGLVLEIPALAETLISAFWPGGLTLVFRAARDISPLLTAGTGRIGVRLSSHPLATGIARALEGPITGTSANMAGAPACREAEEVRRHLGNMVDLIIDGGPTHGEMSSTLVDVTVTPARILREGAVPGDRIRPLIGLTDSPTGEPRSPDMPK